MPRIEIYTTPLCPYCWRAKAFLKRKGAEYDEIDVSGRPDMRRAMAERAGGRTTVPQIFIDGRPIGGSDDLHALDRAGGLDPLLGRA
jgi:glutaredoxin 3